MRKPMLYGHYTAQNFCERLGLNFDIFTDEITEKFMDDDAIRIYSTHGSVYGWVDNRNTHAIGYTLFIEGYDIVVLGIKKLD